MKMILIICPSRRQEEVRELVARHGVHAYSEIADILGEGERGKHLGTVVWPGVSVLIFTVIDEERKDELLSALSGYREQLYPDEGLRAFVLPVEEML